MRSRRKKLDRFAATAVLSEPGKDEVKLNFYTRNITTVRAREHPLVVMILNIGALCDSHSISMYTQDTCVVTLPVNSLAGLRIHLEPIGPKV